MCDRDSVPAGPRCRPLRPPHDSVRKEERVELDSVMLCKIILYAIVYNFGTGHYTSIPSPLSRRRRRPLLVGKTACTSCRLRVSRALPIPPLPEARLPLPLLTVSIPPSPPSTLPATPWRLAASCPALPTEVPSQEIVWSDGRLMQGVDGVDGVSYRCY